MSRLKPAGKQGQSRQAGTARERAMVDLSPDLFRAGPHQGSLPSEPEGDAVGDLRRKIEPWLTALFQSEHLSVLLGSGFTNAVTLAAGGEPATMGACTWGEIDFSTEVDARAKALAQSGGRGSENFEDQIRAALQLRDGLTVMNDDRAARWKAEIDTQLKSFLGAIVRTEVAIRGAESAQREVAEDLLVSFLLSFASRTSTRDRLSIFTTNYDRVMEYGCDLAGLRIIDRFSGVLSPVFRATRLNVDMHYNPPGIRGEPRYLEGVIRACKLHGSIDWRWRDRELVRHSAPFGCPMEDHRIPEEASESVIIYPNPAKDMETSQYPYSELFRDFAAAICRPNSALVTYGYGFGDEHINRVLRDMLTIPSTHLVIIAWDAVNPDRPDDQVNGSRKRIMRFCQKVGKVAQISLLLGGHFGNLVTLVDHYLPKPAIDQISKRKARLEEQRGEGYRRLGGEESNE
ncbi:SIR2 family protein [Gemmatimonadota bacterium]